MSELRPEVRALTEAILDLSEDPKKVRVQKNNEIMLLVENFLKKHRPTVISGPSTWLEPGPDNRPAEGVPLKDFGPAEMMPEPAEAEEHESQEHDEQATTKKTHHKRAARRK